MPAAIIAARHVPSAARLMQLLLLIYLAPTGMTVTALPRATRTTGPVGMAAAGSDGAEPAGALDCWAGTLLRSKRETSAPTVNVVFLSIGREAISIIIWRSASGSASSGTSMSPEAMARSSSAVLSASDRSASDNCTHVWERAIFSAATNELRFGQEG